MFLKCVLKNKLFMRDGGGLPPPPPSLIEICNLKRRVGGGIYFNFNCPD